MAACLVNHAYIGKEQNGVSEPIHEGKIDWLTDWFVGKKKKKKKKKKKLRNDEQYLITGYKYISPNNVSPCFKLVWMYKHYTFCSILMETRLFST